ncbi:MAG: AMP-binding protein [Propionibacteriaceae bacterium]|nr:AMP-binding protein [Propionibacteriaceae bacterium]
MSDDPLAIAEYRPGVSAVLTDAERWPTLTADGAARLASVRHHPAAPRWTHATGDRLTAEQLERTKRPLPTEGWLTEHLAVARRLPAYRRLTGLDTLADFPVISRADLAKDVAAYVPLDADFSRLIHGSSSGSTGAALMIPDDIEEVARSFHLLVDLVRAEGIDWQPDPARMALVNLVMQHQAFTYASVISGFEQASMARINLTETDWPYPGARRDFLLAQNPQVITGDPSTLAELLASDLVGVVRPLALFSGAMALSAPLRAKLVVGFGCPVFDLYGLHDTRPIAVRTDDGPFRILPRRLQVEILDDQGHPVPEGELGEIVVTAGENPLLPLVRYRTGDYARLVEHDGHPALADLEGRAHVRFRAADGSLVSSIDLTQQLQAHGALGWTVHQAADGRITARVVQGDLTGISTALTSLLGQDVTVEPAAALAAGKPRRYSCEAADPPM